MGPAEVANAHDDAWNQKDAEGRKRLTSPGMELEMPGGMNFKGVEQIQMVEGAFWEALPDSQIKISDRFVDGDTVISEGALTGSHTGTFRTPQGDVPASGNVVTLRFASVKLIGGGQIVSERMYFDQMEFLGQIGALPPGPGPS